MLAAITNGSRFAWSDWFLGIMRSFISGGAGALSSGTVVGLKDPNDWGLHSGHLFELMGIVFLATGLLHMAIFLQTHPVPDAMSNAVPETPKP